MSGLLSIGEFSRLTHLSVKALRHYDEVGLLEPTSVDPSSSYRLYAAAQVPAAQLIRRFRDLDMPLEQVRAVLAASTLEQRDELLADHLRRMEARLDETRATVASLRALLEGRGSTLPVEHRHVPATAAVARRQVIAWDETDDWLTGTFTDLDAVVGDRRTGPDGALYSDEFFRTHVGEVVAFVPMAAPAADPCRTARHAEVLEVPAADVAVAVHHGPFADIDTTYGALGTYVTERLLAAPGPIREHYLDGGGDVAPVEVCWPIRSNDTGGTP